MSKKYFFIVIVLSLTFCVQSLYAQYSADIGSKIYEDIEIWEGRGYVRQLPIIRPLPETVLVELMKQVMRKGDFVAQEKADYYFQKLSRFLVVTDIYTNHYANFIFEDGKSSSVRWYGSAGGEFNGFSFVGSPLVSIAVGLGFKIVAAKDNQTNTEIKNYFFDKQHLAQREEIPDSLSFGSLQTIELKGYTNVRTSFTVGKPDIFMQAGFMRRSIGPFYDDGLIVSARAPETGNIFVHWRGKYLAATWGLFMLTSKQEYKKFNSITDNERSAGYKFNKVFFYNSLSWYISPNIEFNIWESVMFGDFNFAYLLPIKVIYAIDALSSFVAGNLFLGFSLDFRLGRTVKLPLSVVIDDISVNDIIKFDFDTKIKVAVQTGVAWTPIHPIFKRLSFDYQLVLPYTYSHAPYSGYLYSTGHNITNHTVHGEHLATTLNPSSHRITVEAKITPVRYFDVSTVFRFSQHNNPSDGILSGPLNDGSILDDGYYSVYDGKEGASFQHRNGFLKGLIEHTFEGGFNIGFEMPITSRINLYGDASYTLKYILNYKLVSGLDRIENVVLFNVGMKIAIN